MMRLSKALITDNSVVFCDVLALLLKPYINSTLTVTDCRHAISTLHENLDIDKDVPQHSREALQKYVDATEDESQLLGALRSG
jgi:hypothetical protein